MNTLTENRVLASSIVMRAGEGFQMVVLNPVSKNLMQTAK